MKVGDWVRFKKHTNGRVPAGFVGTIASFNSRQQGRYNVALKFDSRGGRPNYSATGGFCICAGMDIEPLSAIEVLSYVAREET